MKKVRKLPLSSKPVPKKGPARGGQGRAKKLSMKK